MHYSSLNTGNQDDVFKPEDFLDIDSGDSDNEILQNFKKQDSKVQPPNDNMISLQQPPIAKYVAPYIDTSHVPTRGVEEQTGYSNSPKFSVYRLNNNNTNYQGQTSNEYHAVTEQDSTNNHNTSLLTSNPNQLQSLSPNPKKQDHKTP